MTPQEIRDLRKRLGLTQQVFAQRLGIYTHTVNNWENGHRKPKGLYAAALARLAAETKEKEGC